MFVLGQLDAEDLNEHLFVSLAGAWVRANPDSFALGEAIHIPLAASKKRFGEVFIGSDGLGVYKGQLAVT